jgi:hypothetical protein
MLITEPNIFNLYGTGEFKSSSAQEPAQLRNYW